MALTPGSRLGVYEVTIQIGEGGMGQVYRARDIQLNRDVALKVLPEAFAGDADRLARFTREAQVLASLNHPHIAAIYGIEGSALVMELVEGEDLSQRLARGAIPLDEALPIAKQIAEALEAAHEQGIVHRDLKPANIKVRTDGTVKVLDFGLAKALMPEGRNFSSADPALHLANSPTLTTPAMTQAGMILGTAAYMAPEQAKGRVVDRRADIWAFGAVLFEMLTGKRAFPGEDLTDTLAAVVRAEPDWTLLPRDVSPSLLVFLRRCLQKDPKQRVGDIHDVRLALEGAFDTTAPQTPATTASSSPRGRLAVISALAAAAVVIVALAIPALRHLRETLPEQPSMQLSVPLPAKSEAGYVELSPDGQRLLVSLFRDGKYSLFLRPLNAQEWQPLAGTDNARTPFWSPDSRFIGFFADGALKVIPAAGGPARVLCSEAGIGAGGTWSPSGVILFGNGGGGLLRVDAAGGPCAAMSNDAPPRPGSFPVFLPDGQHFLYLSDTRGDAASTGVYLASLADAPGLTPNRVLADRSSVVYAPPAAGGLAHLLFLREATLMAQPFDDASLQAVGDPLPVVLEATSTFSTPQVAASVSNGTLVYFAAVSRESQLAWFDRSGKTLGTAGSRTRQEAIVMSPDGNTVLTNHVESDGALGMWRSDLVRGTESRVLAAGTQNGYPVWFPDSRRVLFRITSRQDRAGLYQRGVNDGGQPELVLPFSPGTSFNPSTFSPDGRILVYTVVDPKSRADIWYLPWDAKPDLRKAVKFVATDADESQGQVSPDGKWIAYTSNEIGVYHIYVRPFPTGSGIQRVSTESQQPRWSADGKWLYYRRSLTTHRGTLMAAAVVANAQGALRLGTPETLFDVHTARSTIPRANVFLYSPHPDGQRFLVNAAVGDADATINVITNWQTMVAARKAP